MVTLGFGYLTAPENVLTALRAVDPDADLVHLGGNEWMLGVRKENHAARERVERQLKIMTTTRLEVGDIADRAAAESQLGKEFQLLQFFASAPFRPIQHYRIGDGPGEMTFGEVVRDFELRDFNWRTRREEAFRELKDAVSMDVADARRTALVREKVQAEAGDMFRYILRGARNVLQRVNPLSRKG